MTKTDRHLLRMTGTGVALAFSTLLVVTGCGGSSGGSQQGPVLTHDGTSNDPRIGWVNVGTSSDNEGDNYAHCVGTDLLVLNDYHDSIAISTNDASCADNDPIGTTLTPKPTPSLSPAG
jgi:hypothetical protein